MASLRVYSLNFGGGALNIFSSPSDEGGGTWKKSTEANRTPSDKKLPVLGVLSIK